MGERHEEFQKLKKELLEINTQRGGGADKLKGFYAENVNATLDNLERIDSGIRARQVVIDNNGNADAVIRYTNGQFGREIQYKNGYSYSKHKDFLSCGKYDNMIYAVDKDNPIFLNADQMKVLSDIAKEHNIKVVPAKVTDKEMLFLADGAILEGNIRSTIGVEEKPAIAIELYVDAKEAEFYYKQFIKKQVEVNSYIVNQTNIFLNEDLSRVHSSGMSQALGSAQFAAALSISRSAINLIKGEQELSDASLSVIKDTSTAAILGYATGTLSEAIGLPIGDASLLINGAIQISRQIYDYSKGDIDEQQLLINIVENSAYLTAAYIGKTIGGTLGAAGGPIGIVAGQFVGEMITTAICSTIMDMIHREKEAKIYNKKMLSLARRAEREIKEAHDRLRLLLNEENNKFIQTLNDGYDKYMNGILKNDYEEASLGLFTIGEGFGIEAKKLVQGHVTQGKIFAKKDRIIRLG